MSIKQPWVYRRGITIERQSEYAFQPGEGVVRTGETWAATFYGSMSTGETLSLSDVGTTYAEALGRLEETLEGMGLEIRA